MEKSYMSEIVDTVILSLEERLKETNKHLIKTGTIISQCAKHIDLTDKQPEREKLLDIGIRQVVQARLYAHGYFSVYTGYFVNVAECNNLAYLKLIINQKDNIIEDKVAARNRLNKLLSEEGELIFTPDENNALMVIEIKPYDELIEDLEADAV